MKPQYEYADDCVFATVDELNAGIKRAEQEMRERKKRRINEAQI